MIEAATWLVVLIAVIGVFVSIGGRRSGGAGGVGSAAAGAVYDLLNEDKRKALEIIVEDRTAARDTEHADGDLPSSR
jgi:hypothetical protein